MKYLFDPDGVFTSALLRDVDIVLPEGTIVSALPPDGAVFLDDEQNQAMMAALLRAFAQALGPAAMAGDHGGTEIHMAFGAHADGIALGLGRPVRRRDRAVRRQRAR